jgi:aldehyde:ferredoxin oxidoreductase
MGGHWGPALKKAGYDMVIIRGKAPKPTYITINNEEVNLVDAKDLWGKGTFQTNDVLKKRHSANAKVVSIGQAGENLVKYACIVSDTQDVAGRTGMGTIMGSKNLKSIVVKGNGEVGVFSREKMKRARQYVLDILKNDPICTEKVPKLGTKIWFDFGLESGANLPTKNWQETYFDGAPKLSGSNLRSKYLARTGTCFNCHLACHGFVRVPKGKYATLPARIEYFHQCALGTNIFNDDPEVLIKLSEMCNDYGIDIGQLGPTLAFAMESYENNLIGKEDTGRMDISWGNHSAILDMTKQIAFRRGFGDVLAEGVKKTSEIIGGNSGIFAMHVKGLAICSTGGLREAKMLSSRYLVSSRGADHLRAFSPTVSRKESERDKNPLELETRELIHNETICAVIDMMGVCKLAYSGYSANSKLTDLKCMEGLRRLYSAAIGVDLTWNDLSMAAKKVASLERAFNNLQGLTRDDDKFPERVTKEPVPSGPFKGKIYDISEAFIDEYYRQRGWNEDGIPSQKELLSMDLHDVKKDIQTMLRAQMIYLNGMVLK